VPDGKTGIEAFAVIREAMNQKRMVALGRLVMSTRERICAFEVEEQGLLLTTLRTAEEVRDVSELASPELPRPDARMLEIAGRIIEQQAGDFDPTEFRDRYEDALRGVIQQKMKGRPVKPSADTGQESKVVDLMAALRASLGDSPRKPRAANRYSRAGNRTGKSSKRSAA
jgi:DNA end-binding protein Ku